MGRLAMKYLSRTRVLKDRQRTMTQTHQDNVKTKGSERARKVDPPPLEDQSSPLVDFFKQDTAAALILLLAALAALIISNTAYGYHYHVILASEFGFSLGPDMNLKQSLHHWINDGLMSIFFFLVGLEIKRELLVGELASVRKALLPAAAAMGGMVVPALIYAAITYGTDASSGWGIPMATDIAFAMGCIALLGNRVPAALAVFLVALAIVDDLGAVTVIALFYTDQLDFQALLIGGGLIGVSCILSWSGIRSFIPYLLIGAVIWVAFLTSGVHATIAGVLLAFTIPADARYRSPLFMKRVHTLIDEFEEAEDYADDLIVSATQQRVIRKITRECHHVEAPLQRIEYNLHPLCVFVIMPIFAFANSGVAIPFDELGSLLFEPVTLGIALGLMVGKPLGITLFSYFAVKLNMAELPTGVKWSQMAAAGMIAGIGFTMSLFINELAFQSVGAGTAHAASGAGAVVSDAAQRYMMEGKIGIFVASILAGIIGVLWLRAVCGPPDPNAPAASRGH
jgi:NhaA family Na+:H+ antiporter